MLLSNPDSSTRYEVELQLGAPDESHIIGAIKHWDTERRRTPTEARGRHPALWPIGRLATNGLNRRAVVAAGDRGTWPTHVQCSVRGA